MVNQIVGILDYFFSLSPSTEFPLQWIFWLMAGLSVSVAVFCMIKMKCAKDRLLNRHLKEYPSKLITISVLLAINLFSRLNRVEVLSMRFLTYVLVLWLLFSFYELYRDYFVFYPKDRAEHPKK